MQQAVDIPTTSPVLRNVAWLQWSDWHGKREEWQW